MDLPSSLPASVAAGDCGDGGGGACCFAQEDRHFLLQLLLQWVGGSRSFYKPPKLYKRHPLRDSQSSD